MNPRSPGQGRGPAPGHGGTASGRLRQPKAGLCDPASPWQRGSNENMNGLFRQYFPKGTDLSGYGPDHLQAVADEINSRPRKMLGWQPSADCLERLVRSVT